MAKAGGRPETYTIDYSGKAPVGTVIGRLTEGGVRFVAMTDPEDPQIVQRMIAAEPLGATVMAKLNTDGRAILVGFVPAS